MSEKEKIYDELIAPLLLQAGKIAQEHGIPIVAQCEYAPDEFGLTANIGKSASAAMKILYFAAMCKGNVDRLYLSIKNEWPKDSSSMVLSLMERRD